MRKLALLLFLFITVYPIVSYSQQQLNLDFEKESVEGLSRPWGWQLDTWGAHVFSMDTTKVKNGRFSLKVDAKSETEQKQILRCNLEPYFIADKTIQLNGSIFSKLAKGISSIEIGYSILDAENNYKDTSQLVFEKKTSSNKWEEFRTSIHLPKNIVNAFVKINIEGKGIVWYDNLQLIIDGKEYHQLPVAPNFSASEIKWFKENAHPFHSVTNKPNKSTNFNFLKPFIKDTRIVALGESTHGTSEFFILKHQVFKYAVEKLGFRVFALEDNQLSCERVNSYILGKSDISAVKSMSSLFAVWNTEEVKNLVEWMKQWNKKHPNDLVYFAGFDMQDYKLPLDALKTFLKKRHPILLKEIEGYEEFAANSFSANDSIKQKWLNKTTNVYNKLNRTLASNYNNQMELQNAKLLKQYTENVLKGHWSLYRDEAMADNIDWLATIKYPSKKIFVWAHDVHISKSNHPMDIYNLNSGIAMGHFLKKKFKNNYKAFGLLTSEGAYLAIKSYSNFDKVNAPLYKAPKGSIEEALQQVASNSKKSNLFLYLQKFENWFERPVPMRFANHVSIDYGFWQRISIPYQFDGIFFIDKTTPTKYLNR